VSLQQTAKQDCAIFIIYRCSMCPHCCSTTHSSRLRHWPIWHDQWNDATVCPTQWHFTK